MYAHITKINNNIIKQTLKEHCLNSAQYALYSVCDNLKSAAFFCGLIHDMGKAKKEFQEYLINAFNQDASAIRGSVNHTFSGVIWILENRPDSNPITDICVEILAYTVGAHHGLFDLSDFDGNFGLEHRFKYNKDKIHYEESIHNFYTNIMCYEKIYEFYLNAISELSELITNINNGNLKKYPSRPIESNYTTFFDIGMICRMLLSAVIYGDRRDTIEFMQQITISPTQADWSDACNFYENKISKFNSDTILNKVRSDISKQCLSAAQKECGIYRLDVPTGGGKTLSSFRYAIHHAQKYNKKRIIYVIPYLTIIEQNASVLKEFYNKPENLLEHHSNVVSDSNKSDAELRFNELLATTWDAPVIMTTMVQFLDILFSHKTSAIGRMQALNDSIVIFDEIQSIPRKSTYMFIQAVNYLSHYCECTAILCSATQPSFGDIQYPLWYSDHADLVTLTEEQKAVFKRTNIIDARVSYGMSIDGLAEFCKKISHDNASVMCICNTKKEAAKLYAGLQNLDDTDVYHISNAMCKSHINDVLNNVKRKLKEIQAGDCNKKLILVSTQIPEAGVDISFQAVIRVLAGLDNIIQSDGRCNRSNEYESGTTYIVNLDGDTEKTQYIPDIKYMQDATIKVLEDGKTKQDIMSEEASNLYFRTLFNYTKDILGYPYEGTTLIKLLSNDLKSKNEYRLTIPFKTVGYAYNVIDGATTDVLVPYKPYAEILEELKSILEHDKYNLGQIKDLIKQLKNCTINLYDYQVEQLKDNGLLYSYLDESIFILAENAYSEMTGLTIPQNQEGMGIII